MPSQERGRIPLGLAGDFIRLGMPYFNLDYVYDAKFLFLPGHLHVSVVLYATKRWYNASSSSL